MMELFGFKSKNAVFKVVEKLIEAGLVAKDHLGDLFLPNLSVKFRCSVFVTAGLPATVEEELTDTVNLDDFLIKINR